MLAETALTGLLLTAQGLGLRPAPIQPLAGPREVLRLSLEEIVRDQERAYVDEAVGRGRLEFTVGLDPEAGLWAKFRRGGHLAAYPLSRLSQGLTVEFPDEPLHLVYENGNLRAYPLSHPQRPQALVSVPGLIRGLYDAALHVLFGSQDYAIVYESGPVPPSVSLMRRDYAGKLWITHKTAAQLREIAWFGPIDGTLYGMRIEGDWLVFYSKLPNAADLPVASERGL